MPGSGITLPLDLRHIASLCKGSFYAPKRFAVRVATLLHTHPHPNPHVASPSYNLAVP